MATIDRSIRYRVNVTTTSKGVKSYDCTVAIEGPLLEDVAPDLREQIDVADRNEVLRLSDALVAELDKRYPAPVEG